MSDQPRYRYLKIDTVQDVLVVTLAPSKLEGDDMAQCILMDLQAAVAHAKADKVVLNLEHVEYLTSANFRPFLGLQKQLKAAGGRMVLCGLTERVLEMFQLMRLLGPTPPYSGYFEAQPDVDAAVARLTDNRESASAPKQ
jgi:anti-anti-sigma factor